MFYIHFNFFKQIKACATKITAVKTSSTTAAKANPTTRVNRRQMRVFYLPPIVFAPNNENAKNGEFKTKIRRRKQVSINDHKVKALREEYKKGYVQPPLKDIPYNKNMARQFESTKDLTAEERVRRDRQALASRVSRDRLKFVDDCVEKEHAALEDELMNSLMELLIAEELADQYCISNGMEPTDWNKMWNDKHTNTA